MEDEISYRCYKLHSVLRLELPGLVVFGVLPASIELIYLIVGLSLNLHQRAP